MANDIEAPTALATTTGVSAASVNFDNVNTDLNTLDNKVVQLKENRDYWKNMSELYEGFLNMYPSLTCYSNRDEPERAIFMGFAESEENKGKAIYMIVDCLKSTLFSMNDLLKINGIIQTNKGVGECDIIKQFSDNLDKYIYARIQRHLQPYVRTYDGHTSSEKVFLPLECEVFGKNGLYSKDKSTFDKYPQWRGFTDFTRIKNRFFIDSDNSRKYNPSNWWVANISNNKDKYCSINTLGNSSEELSTSNIGLSLAFCI